MSKKIKKELSIEKKIKGPKTPKFKLVSYTLKAVIPTGQYANIQPEITVQADSIENAERAVMPYIEALFAKYREGGGPVTPHQVPKPVVATSVSPVVTKIINNESGTLNAKTSNPETKIEIGPNPPTIIMTVPYTRAKTAIDSCTSVDSLKLVLDQIKKSTKLINSERLELTIIAEKRIANFPAK